MSKPKRNEKYLKLDDSGVWHLIFRVPARFGGRLIRQSLFTEDFDVAASIRDRYVVPILASDSGIAALEEIGKSIIAAEGDAIKYLGRSALYPDLVHLDKMIERDWFAEDARQASVEFGTRRLNDAVEELERMLHL